MNKVWTQLSVLCLAAVSGAASLATCSTANAAMKSWCKITGNETATHSDGSDNPWVDELSTGYFPLELAKADDTNEIEINYLSIKISGLAKAAHMTVDLKSFAGLDSLKAQSLFSGEMDFSKSVDQTFTVVGNPVVYKYEGTSTTLQSIRLTCQTGYPESR